MNSHRLLGGAVASALIAAGWAGTTFSQVAAQSAYDQVSFSPNPIAAAATLTSGESVTVCVQAKDRKSTRLNSSHTIQSRMPSSA